MNDFNACVNKDVPKKIYNPFFTLKQINRDVYLSFNKAGNTLIEVYDFNGISAQSLHSNSEQAVINLSSLKSGVYIIKVTRAESLKERIFLQ